MRSLHRRLVKVKAPVNGLEGSLADPELVKRVVLGQTAPAELESSPLTR